MFQIAPTLSKDSVQVTWSFDNCLPHAGYFLMNNPGDILCRVRFTELRTNDLRRVSEKRDLENLYLSPRLVKQEWLRR